MDDIRGDGESISLDCAWFDDQATTSAPPSPQETPVRFDERLDKKLAEERKELEVGLKAEQTARKKLEAEMIVLKAEQAAQNKKSERAILELKTEQERVSVRVKRLEINAKPLVIRAMKEHIRGKIWTCFFHRPPEPTGLEIDRYPALQRLYDQSAEEDSGLQEEFHDWARRHLNESISGTTTGSDVHQFLFEPSPFQDTVRRAANQAAHEQNEEMAAERICETTGSSRHILEAMFFYAYGRDANDVWSEMC
ncbi:hypothetical protein BDN72DRAFT_962393 [Pluteus cervinus]|uniref:Uncharacterized protein n=1 Tax=Pluteus cervinus TaxID=181527 RepID=A0ACD3AIP5_9AGAR|nr:hypothetical protein BDN72DRAFT_962393 [Pluteus cervinus]